MPRHLSRRHFLQAAAGAALGAETLLRAEEKKLAANERFHVGVVGTFNRAGANINDLVAAGAEIVALCDVDENHSGKVRERFPMATFDVDYRKMIDRKGLDAVLCATPDHQHAFGHIGACAAGRSARLLRETVDAHRR